MKAAAVVGERTLCEGFSARRTLVARMADRGDHRAGPIRPRADPIRRLGFVDRWFSKDRGRRTIPAGLAQDSGMWSREPTQLSLELATVEEHMRCLGLVGRALNTI